MSALQHLNPAARAYAANTPAALSAGQPHAAIADHLSPADAVATVAARSATGFDRTPSQLPVGRSSLDPLMDALHASMAR